MLVYDLAGLTKIPFRLKLDSVAPRIAVDSSGNRLIVVSKFASPVVQVYALPAVQPTTLKRSQPGMALI